MIVRHGLIADLEDLEALQRDAFEASTYRDLAAYDDITATRILARHIIDESLFVAHLPGASICGMMALIQIPYVYNAKYSIAQECLFWVRRVSRGLGAGSGLLSAAGAWARDRGCSGFVLSSRHDKEADAAGEMLRRRGFVQVERQYLQRL